MKTNRKALIVLLAVLAASLASVSVFAFVYGTVSAANSPTAIGANGDYSNWMSGNQWGNMMGGMMGGNSGPSSTPNPLAASQNSVLPLIALVALVGAAIAGAGGAVYYFVSRPKTAFAQMQPTVNKVTQTVQEKVEAPIDSVSKTLTTDERKVFDVLTAHDGVYLQKYIRSETGLSRLKVHRIVTRLAERGIVTLEQSGNTNKVYLSSWLAEQPFSKIKPKENGQQEMVVNA